MIQNAYFSLLTHTKQLLLVKFGDKLAGIEVSFWTDGTEIGTGTTDGWTDKRGSRYSYLDVKIHSFLQEMTLLKKKYLYWVILECQ